MNTSYRGTSAKIKRIGLVFNLKKNASSFSEDYEEFDDPETIAAIAGAIQTLGFKVDYYEQDKRFLKNISLKRPDFIFNIAEGIGNGRSRESQVPCVLDSLGLPYTGSDPVAMGLTLDKYLSNCILKARGVPVPEMHMAVPVSNLERFRFLFSNRRFLLKPRWEGSSKGIHLNSIVSSLHEFKTKAAELSMSIRQPLLLEEYLPGDEVTVGLCGNGDGLEILGMMKISSSEGNQTDFIYSLEVKRDWRRRVIYMGQDHIQPDVRDLIGKTALRAFRILELQDIARIDFRLDNKGVPKIIDVNPLPGLSPTYSDLPILFGLNGGTYPALIKKILSSAFLRYKIFSPSLPSVFDEEERAAWMGSIHESRRRVDF
jgi:D-alanine-D-alanine ligase